MSLHTDELLKKHGLTPDDVHLPAGGVAIHARTGSGKSSLFYNSQFVRLIILADTGSASHSLYALPGTRIVPIDPHAKLSPIQTVLAEVRQARKDGVISLVDSWSTLQEQQVAWFKMRPGGRGYVSLPEHQGIVGDFRDLALELAGLQVFTTFNTSPGGSGKTPTGEHVVYPSGAITGYPSLSGVGLNSETILARWSNVWGVFAGFKGKLKNGEQKDIPRGLYVPGEDPRPDEMSKYAPLKDPLMVIRDTSEGQGIMRVPDLRIEDERGRCFVDELLVEASARWRRPAAEKKPGDKKAGR